MRTRFFNHDLSAAAALCLSLILVVAGCSESDTIELDEKTMAELATLPGLRQSTRAELREHYQQLEAEGATPLGMRRPPLPEEENAAAIFADLFAKSFLKHQFEKSAELMPGDDFSISDDHLQRIQLFRRQLEPQRAKAATALDRPKSDFGIDHALGWYADPTYLQAVTLYVRLEAFLAAERLDQNNLTAAMKANTRMFRVAELLSFERDVNARMFAVGLRDEALTVMAAVLRHNAVDSATARHYYHLLENQLVRWPNDASAWIGDRAVVLVSYEAVRQGLFHTLLTPDELPAMLLNHNSKNLNADAAQGVDNDELFYLDEMRTIIDSCNAGTGNQRRSVPFYRRRDVFARMLQSQQRKTDAGEYPLVAAELFLPHIEGEHRMQAVDRARVEMWCLALATSLGQPPPDYKTNPVSGEPYHVSVEPRDVVVLESKQVTPESASEVIVVPRFDARASRKDRRYQTR